MLQDICTGPSSPCEGPVFVCYMFQTCNIYCIVDERSIAAL